MSVQASSVGARRESDLGDHIRAVKSIELTGPINYVEANFLSGPQTLPIRFEA